MDFIWNDKFLRSDCYYKLRDAITVLGNMIFYPPASGMTKNGVDYLPVYMMYTREEINDALKVVQDFMDESKNKVLDIE